MIWAKRSCQVLTAAQGQNPARQAHVNAGLPVESAAWGINQVCGSGLRAVALGAQHIQLGDASIVAAGGQENMSMSTHAAALRQGQKTAQKAGKFSDEITPFVISTRKGDITVDSDEYIRHGATMEAMAKLRPAFTKDGSVTAPDLCVAQSLGKSRLEARRSGSGRGQRSLRSPSLRREQRHGLGPGHREVRLPRAEHAAL